MDPNREFLRVPAEKNARGEWRHAGFEIEYADVKLPICVAALKRRYGGRIEMVNPYHYTLRDTQYGTFKVMIDFQFLAGSKLKSWVREYGLDGVLDEEMIERIERFLASVGESVVPYEVTTPPLPLHALEEAQTIKEMLRKLGAKGTRASPLYAFGMHINPELRSVDVETILTDLRAFFILYDHIMEWLEPDLTRRITPYINPFDTDYRLMVLSESYQPTMEELIDDYLAYNPTRNRVLDLLPLLSWIDEERVRRVLPDEKIGKRPTYHYRLPDSRVDEEAWCVCQGWNSWALVERLAADPEALEELRGRMLEYLSVSPLSILLRDDYTAAVARWIDETIR